MRTSLVAATTATVIALAVALSGCASPDTEAPASSSSAAPESSAPVEAPAADDRTGSFAGLNDKKVAGAVSVSGGELVLSGFSSDEGPDLKIYLTNGTDQAAVAAGRLVEAVSFDTASQTFSLPDVDTSTFTHVVINCDKAKAVFGAAELS